jgi:hypothetical protein
MSKKKLRIAAVLFLVSVIPLFSQIQSLEDLDRESAGTAARIQQYPAGKKTIEITSFSNSGTESPLGNYWRLNLFNLLAGSANFTLLAPGSTVRGAYILSGEIIDLGQTIRIFTRITDRNSSALLASWSNDLGKSPFLDGLLAAADGSTAVRDSYEEDSRENPVEVSIDGPAISRTLHQGDADWFVIRPGESALVALETSGSTDTMMELYEGGNLVADNDDGGDDENARIIYQLSAGTSYLAMVKAYSRETGSYRFSAQIVELPDKDMEPNNTRETASSIDLRRLNRAYLSPADQDWYSFTLNDPAGIVLSIGGLNALLELYDAEGSQLASTSRSDERTTRTSQSLEGGTYFILVKGRDRKTTGLYTLHSVVRESRPGDSYEPDDDQDRAKEITPGEAQQHSFTDGYDEDWVFFTVDTAGTFSIRARGGNDRLDTTLALFDENGRKIDDDDDGGAGYSSLLRRRLVPGRYHVCVGCLDQEPGAEYILSVDRE